MPARAETQQMPGRVELGLRAVGAASALPGDASDSSAILETVLATRINVALYVVILAAVVVGVNLIRTRPG